MKSKDRYKKELGRYKTCLCFTHKGRKEHTFII